MPIGMVIVDDEVVDITKVILSMQSYFSADDNDQPESLWRFVSADFATLPSRMPLRRMAITNEINYNTLDGDVSDAELHGDQAGRCQSGLEPGQQRGAAPRREPETRYRFPISFD